jgi:superfamily II DNA or RNA helicase
MKTVTDWTKLGLWSHQNQAVEKVRSYIESDADGAALVRMPTGTGKTAVMAVLSQCFPDTPYVLIVAHGRS